MIKTLRATAGLLAVTALASAQAVSVTTPAFSYGQSFDSLTTSTAATPWVNDSTLAGWSLFIASGAAAPTYGADIGSSNAGTFRSFGAAGNGERALGSVASGGAYFGAPATGAVAGWIAVAFSNDTGSALSGFDIGYSGEQWRNGGNTATQSLVLEYGYGATFAAVTSWTAPGGSFDFTSPVVGATAAAVDGNAAGLVTGLGGSVGTSWAAGDTLWVRWADRNDLGNDHGLAIDNLSFSVSAVPEPGNWALLSAGLAMMAFIVRRRRLPGR